MSRVYYYVCVGVISLRFFELYITGIENNALVMLLRILLIESDSRVGALSSELVRAHLQVPANQDLKFLHSLPH